MINRKRSNYPSILSAGVIISLRRNNYPPDGGTQEKGHKHFL